MEEDLEDRINAKLEYLGKILSLIRHFCNRPEELEFGNTFQYLVIDLRKNKKLQSLIKQTTAKKAKREFLNQKDTKKLKFKEKYTNLFSQNSLKRKMTHFSTKTEKNIVNQEIKAKLSKSVLDCFSKTQLRSQFKQEKPNFTVGMPRKVRHRKTNSLEIKRDTRFVTVYLGKDKSAKVVDLKNAFKSREKEKLPQIFGYLTNQKIKVQMKRTYVSLKKMHLL